MQQFWGKDFGIIALAKNFLASKPVITVSRERVDQAISEDNFWLPAVKDVTEKKTKFGRIGIVFDRKNKEARAFCKSLAKEKFTYQQRNSRAEKSAKFSLIETQVTREMANEGLADSTEFRISMRKYIRNAKNLHLDSILFLEGIFAEKDTQKIIKKIAGTQIKIYFVTDFLGEKENTDVTKKSFEIKTDGDLAFTKQRAEQILQRKLKEEAITSV